MKSEALNFDALIFDEETDQVLVFLTNHLMLAAATVAAVYNARWEIELSIGNSDFLVGSCED